jgi:hypothetical protein
LNITSEVMATSITASETVKADTVKAETVDVAVLTGHNKIFKVVSPPEYEYGSFPNQVDVVIDTLELVDNGHYIIIEELMTEGFPMNRNTSSSIYVMPSNYNLGSVFQIAVFSTSITISCTGPMTGTTAAWQGNFEDFITYRLKIFQNTDKVNITGDVNIAGDANIGGELTTGPLTTGPITTTGPIFLPMPGDSVDKWVIRAVGNYLEFNILTGDGVLMRGMRLEQSSTYCNLRVSGTVFQDDYWDLEPL